MPTWLSISSHSSSLLATCFPGATLAQRVATGFHRLTTCNVEAGVDPEENRTNQIIDRVKHDGNRLAWHDA